MRAAPRPGVILLVVLALLTLFALVGLSFVLYAGTEAASARLFREAQSGDRPDLPPELLLGYFLGQLLYDVPDDAAGVASALRGHSLARLLYGYNDQGSNTLPFNGTGRLHAPSPFPGIDDYNVVNYTYYPSDGFLRDPERLGWRTDLTQPRGPFTGGFNASYTYPDLNNLFLAAVKADGTLLLPSFHRSWTGFGSLDPNNPHWYDATKPWLKYLVLRPRPADMGPGFPAPEDTGGDVKNLQAAPGGNDSIWIDLGFPVLQAPGGRRYKPLFAPLILDLDNRVNVNVHGNVQGRDAQGRPAHTSYYGQGPQEVSLQPVLGRQPRGVPEWLSLFSEPASQHRAFAPSNLEALLRYGDTGSPALTSELFRLCPDSFTDPRGRRLVTTHSFDLDQPGGSPWVYDPLLFPYAAPGAGSDAAPTGPPIPFPPLALRREPVPPHSEFGAPGLPPQSPGVDWRALTGAAGRLDLNRRLTPYPPDLHARFDVPAQAPAFLQAQLDRQRLANDLYDRLLAVTGVPRTARVPNQPTPEELQVRRWLAQLAVNIVDFRDEDDIHTPFNFYTAHDAELLPFDIGALSPSGSPPVEDPELPTYWVLGTELPRVVVHEVLAEYQEQDPAPPGGPVHTLVKVWVELHRPVQTPVAGQPLNPLDFLPVPLQVDAAPNSVTGKSASYSPYRVVVAPAFLPRPFNDNVLGKPAAIRCSTTDADFASPARQVGGGVQAETLAILASGAFCLLGPPETSTRLALVPPPTGTVPPETPWWPSANLQYQYTTADPQPEERASGLAVLLRRLANPHLPFDPLPRVIDANGDPQPNPWYNPYVTVDALEQILLRNATDPQPYASRGKRQPYASHPSQVVDQVSARPTQPTQHTFGLPNHPPPPSGAPDWLVHLDRPLVSPMELLHVSGYQPYQLGQRFVRAANGQPERRFQHYVPWFDQGRRLYRIFESLVAAVPATGAASAPGGRVPGKINLNTIWDSEIFLALCDPQSVNGPHFTVANVHLIFQQLLALRTPQLLSGGGPGPQDRPFLSLATGYAHPASPANPDPQRPHRGTGINDTLLRSREAQADALPDGGAATPRLFQIPGEEHPYRQAELLTKICNQVTTRSNVFAVWVTVGFFEVTDDASRPVKLGAEIGRAESRHRRHRLFALVDRSAIAPDPRPLARFDPRKDAAVMYASVIE
jgi:hypothetical protein